MKQLFFALQTVLMQHGATILKSDLQSTGKGVMTIRLATMTFRITIERHS